MDVRTRALGSPRVSTCVCVCIFVWVCGFKLEGVKKRENGAATPKGTHIHSLTHAHGGISQAKKRRGARLYTPDAHPVHAAIEEVVVVASSKRTREEREAEGHAYTPTRAARTHIYYNESLASRAEQHTLLLCGARARLPAVGCGNPPLSVSLSLPRARSLSLSRSSFYLTGARETDGRREFRGTDTYTHTHTLSRVRWCFFHTCTYAPRMHGEMYHIAGV